MEEDKKLDDFIGKSIKSVGLDKPSLDFTNSVLSKIQVESQTKAVFEYRPIISKSTWAIIFAIVVAIFTYVIFGNSDQGNTWFSFSQLNMVTSFNVLGKMSSFELSNTFVYGILVFTFFLLIQVLLIKQRFERHYKPSGH